MPHGIIEVILSTVWKETDADSGGETTERILADDHAILCSCLFAGDARGYTESGARPFAICLYS